MVRLELRRTHVLAAAAAVFAFLVVQVAVAGGGESGAGPEAQASATVRQQLKKLKRQVAALRAKVDGISNQSGGATGTAGGDLRGTYPNPQIAANAVTTDEVLDETLTDEDLATDSVRPGEVLNESLAAADLGPSSVASSEVLNESLAVGDLGSGSVGSSEVVNESLTTDDLGPSSVGFSEIVDGSIGTQDQSFIPSARVRRTAAQSITQNTFTGIQLTSETWDNFAIHSNALNNTRLTAPVTGFYLITANVFWQSDSNGIRQLGVRHNGTDFIAAVGESAADTSEDQMALTTVYRLVAGDFVEAMVQQTTAGALNLEASSGGAETSPEFSMTWLGPA